MTLIQLLLTMEIKPFEGCMTSNPYHHTPSTPSPSYPFQFRKCIQITLPALGPLFVGPLCIINTTTVFEKELGGLAARTELPSRPEQRIMAMFFISLGRREERKNCQRAPSRFI